MCGLPPWAAESMPKCAAPPARSQCQSLQAQCSWASSSPPSCHFLPFISLPHPSTPATPTSQPSSSSPPTPLPDPAGQPPDNFPVETLPTLDSILHLWLPTIHHVPKGARDAWSLLVGKVIASVIASPSQSDGWYKLFMLARCILTSPPRGRSVPLEGHSEACPMLDSEVVGWQAV